MRLIALFCVPIIMILGLGACSGPSETVSYPLHSMNIKGVQTSSGSYFLIAANWSKSEAQVFYYYAENPDGTIQLHRNEREDMVFAQIKDGSKPRVTCKDSDPEKRMSKAGYETGYDCVFYIPADAIGGGYDVKVK